MRVFVVEPPAPVVTWEEADQHLKLDGDMSQQTQVKAMIAAATSHIDGPDGWLGRAIGVQTLEARFDLLSCGSVVLPYPPVIDLVDVKYLDAQNVERPADLEDFEVLGREVVSVASDFPWLGGSMRREAGRIRYRAGYEVIPPAIRAAILLMVGDLYANRESTVSGTSAGAIAVPMSTSVEQLLAPFRVFI